MKIKPNSKPIRFITANGPINSLGKCVKELKLIGKTKFQVLKDTPNVLSVGRLVRENKIAFHWPIDAPPYFETEDGILELRVRNDVPYFSESDVLKLKNMKRVIPEPPEATTTTMKQPSEPPVSLDVSLSAACKSDCSPQGGRGSLKLCASACNWCGRTVDFSLIRDLTK